MPERWGGARAGDWLSPAARAYTIGLVVVIGCLYGLLFSERSEELKGMLGTLIGMVLTYYFMAPIRKGEK